jgi:hypothetical protein
VCSSFRCRLHLMPRWCFSSSRCCRCPILEKDVNYIVLYMWLRPRNNEH